MDARVVLQRHCRNHVAVAVAVAVAVVVAAAAVAAAVAVVVAAVAVAVALAAAATVLNTMPQLASVAQRAAELSLSDIHLPLGAAVRVHQLTMGVAKATLLENHPLCVYVTGAANQ
jgi:hypothetical protein